MPPICLASLPGRVARPSGVSFTAPGGGPVNAFVRLNAGKRHPRLWVTQVWRRFILTTITCRHCLNVCIEYLTATPLTRIPHRPPRSAQLPSMRPGDDRLFFREFDVSPDQTALSQHPAAHIFLHRRLNVTPWPIQRLPMIPLMSRTEGYPPPTSFLTTLRRAAFRHHHYHPTSPRFIPAHRFIITSPAVSQQRPVGSTEASFR